MKSFSQMLCLLLCLLFLGGGALAADGGADTLPDRISDFWDSLELQDALDLSSLTAGVRALAEESAQLDDEALEARIRALAEEQGIPLNDAQIKQLLQLVRSLETGIEKGNSAKGKLQAIQTWLVSCLQTLRDLFRRIAEAFQRIGGWLDKLL